MMVFMPYPGQVCRRAKTANSYISWNESEWDKVVVKDVTKPIIGSEKQYIRFLSMSGASSSMVWEEFVCNFQPIDV